MSHHFDLHNYFEAQALDYLFLMDDDSDVHMVRPSYDAPSPSHPLMSQDSGKTKDYTVSASALSL